MRNLYQVFHSFSTERGSSNSLSPSTTLPYAAIHNLLDKRKTKKESETTTKTQELNLPILNVEIKPTFMNKMSGNEENIRNTLNSVRKMCKFVIFDNNPKKFLNSSINSSSRLKEKSDKLKINSTQSRNINKNFSTDLSTLRYEGTNETILKGNFGQRVIIKPLPSNNRRAIKIKKLLGFVDPRNNKVIANIKNMSMGNEYYKLNYSDQINSNALYKFAGFPLSHLLKHKRSISCDKHNDLSRSKKVDIYNY